MRGGPRARPGRGAGGRSLGIQLDLGLRSSHDLGLGDEDEVEGGALDGHPAEALAQQPPRPVPHPRLSQPPADGEAEAGLPALRAAPPPVTKRGPESRRPAAQHAPVVRAPVEALAGPEARPRRHGRASSDRQPLASLLPPPLEHEPSALAAHADEEAVRPLPASACWAGTSSSCRPLTCRWSVEPVALEARRGRGQILNNRPRRRFLSTRASAETVSHPCLTLESCDSLMDSRAAIASSLPWSLRAAFPQVLKSLCKKASRARAVEPDLLALSG